MAGSLESATTNVPCGGIHRSPVTSNVRHLRAARALAVQPVEVRRAVEGVLDLEPLSVVSRAGDRRDHQLVDAKRAGRERLQARAVGQRVDRSSVPRRRSASCSPRVVDAEGSRAGDRRASRPSPSSLGRRRHRERIRRRRRRLRARAARARRWTGGRPSRPSTPRPGPAHGVRAPGQPPESDSPPPDRSSSHAPDESNSCSAASAPQFSRCRASPDRPGSDRRVACHGSDAQASMCVSQG